MSEDQTPIERLHQAIVEFASEGSECDEGCSVVIPSAVVVWEEMHFGGEGQANLVKYAHVGDQFLLSAAMGLLELGKRRLAGDALGEPLEDE